MYVSLINKQFNLSIVSLLAHNQQNPSALS